MAKLVTASRFADPDAAYVALVDARRNLSDVEPPLSTPSSSSFSPTTSATLTC
jgi:hypothetical protein